jgi:molybdopterin converting factor subunit 1
MRPVRIELLAFASASDALGAAELAVEVPDGARVAELKDSIQRLHPAMGSLWEGLAIAVNGELCQDDRALADGDEVALLPPVSGGCAAGEGGVLQESPLDVSEVARRVAADSCGALVLFVGNVRDHHEGREVAKITYSAYRSMAEERIRAICSELGEKYREARVAIAHRLGDIEVGEASVVIAVASPHRATGYDASREALERLKAEVPIWKREHYRDGEVRWREEESLVENE